MASIRPDYIPYFRYHRENLDHQNYNLTDILYNINKVTEYLAWKDKNQTLSQDDIFTIITDSLGTFELFFELKQNLTLSSEQEDYVFNTVLHFNSKIDFFRLVERGIFKLDNVQINDLIDSFPYQEMFESKISNAGHSRDLSNGYNKSFACRDSFFSTLLFLGLDEETNQKVKNNILECRTEESYNFLGLNGEQFGLSENEVIYYLKKSLSNEKTCYDSDLNIAPIGVFFSNRYLKDRSKISKEGMLELIKWSIENNYDNQIPSIFYNSTFKLPYNLLTEYNEVENVDIEAIKLYFEVSPQEWKEIYSKVYREHEFDLMVPEDNSKGVQIGLQNNNFDEGQDNSLQMANYANKINGGKLNLDMARIANIFGQNLNAENYALALAIKNAPFSTGGEKLLLDQVPYLKEIGLTEFGEKGLGSLEKILNDFKVELLNPKMTLKSLKEVRTKINYGVFQSVFMTFVRQNEGQFGNDGVESLKKQLDDLIQFYQKKGLSESDQVNLVKEGYEAQSAEVSHKVETIVPLNNEVVSQLQGFCDNLEKSKSFVKEKEGRNDLHLRLLRLSQTGKGLILNIINDAKSELENFNQDDKKYEGKNPEKIKIGLEQKLERTQKLWNLVAPNSTNELGFSTKAVVDNWVEVFNELSQYQNKPIVKEFLQLMMFAVYATESEHNTLPDYIVKVWRTTKDIKALDPFNPDIKIVNYALDFVDHIVNQETWKEYLNEIKKNLDIARLPEGEDILNPTKLVRGGLNVQIIDRLRESRRKIKDLSELKKFDNEINKMLKAVNTNLNKVLNVNSIASYVETYNNRQTASEDKDKLEFEPRKDYLLEVSGKLCDACWAGQYELISEKFENITFVNIRSKENKLEGGFMLMEIEGEKGEKVLTIRGLNPLMSSIDKWDAKSFVESVCEYTKETAKKIGAKPAIVIDHHTGGSCSNRPAIYQYCSERLKPTLNQLLIKNDNLSNFNGYNISCDVYELI